MMETHAEHLGSAPEPVPGWGTALAKLFSCSVPQFYLL